MKTIYPSIVVFVFYLVFSTLSVTANVVWTDQVSPITHGNWADLTVTDFNRDGIADIVAANPSNTEVFSPATGLPVWLGSAIYEGNRFSWKLSYDSFPSGRTPGIPYAKVGNGSNLSISRVLNGNPGNMMAKWDIKFIEKESIYRVYTTGGSNVFTVTIPDGVDFFDIFHTEMQTWTFTQVSLNTFTITSSKYGSQDNLLFFTPDNPHNATYHSDRDEIIFDVTMQDYPAIQGDAFAVITEPAKFTITSRYHGEDEGTVQVDNTRNYVRMGEYVNDRYTTFGLRIEPGMAVYTDVQPGDEWYYYSPSGPETNKIYLSVETGDFNHDGQDDIAACGPDGIDVYLQDGPKISPIGFRAGYHRGHDCPTWAPESIDIALKEASWVPDSILYTEQWTLTYDQNNGQWNINGEYSGDQEPYVTGEAWPGTRCGNFAINSIDGVYCNGDQYSFSTFRVSWSNDKGPSTTVGYNSIILGDVNLDGDLDILASKVTGGLDVFYYNDETEQWTQGLKPTFNSPLKDMKLRDINRDGRLDLIACSESLGIHVWIGLSGGNWSQDYGPETESGMTSIALNDFNKDGLIDIAGTSINKGVHVFYLRSDGQWYQRAKASIPEPGRDNVGDGSVSSVKVSNEVTRTESWTLECIQASTNGGVFSVRGTESGLQSQNAVVGVLYTSAGGEVEFTIYDGATDYIVTDFFTFDTGKGPLSYIKYSDLDSSDLDNDGNMDLFAASDTDKGIRIWRGNGIYGWTSDTAAQEFGSWRTVNSKRDINFDGNPDIVAGSNLLAGIHIWIGDGSDKFGWSGWTKKPIATGKFAKVTQGDFDLDGKIDIAACNVENGQDGIWVLKGDNVGNFDVQAGPTSKSQYYSIAVADFNLDGRPDIAGGHQSEGFDVWFSEGQDQNGTWLWSDSHSAISDGYFFDLYASDINLDGAPDIVAARNFTSTAVTGLMLYYNNGYGEFGTSPDDVMSFPDTVFNHWGVAVNDLDANGLPDIIVTKNVGTWSLQIYYQLTLGNFAYASFLNPSGYDLFYGVDSTDFNLDSIPDLVTGEDGHGILVGYSISGVKSTCRLAFASYDNKKIRDIGTMDLTNDGASDFVAATLGSGLIVYRNVISASGSSSFTAMTQPAISGDYIGITLSDFTSDGLPDIIAGSEGSGTSGLAMFISNRDFSMVQLSGTYPQPGGVFNVGADESVFLNFNKQIDTSTITYENIQIKKGVNLVAYSLFTLNDNSTIRIDPINIERQVEYEVIIRGGSEGIRDNFGNQFDGNKNGKVEESPTDDFKFTFTTIDLVPPSTPTGLLVQPIDGGVILTWTPNTDPVLDEDLYGYWISYKAESESLLREYLLPAAAYGSPPVITINGLDNDVPYIFSIVAHDFSGNISDYAEFVGATPRAAKPQIWYGGMYNSDLSTSNGGQMTIMAYVLDYQYDIDKVELYVQGTGTGVLLKDDGNNGDFGPNDGVYALTAPINPGISQIKFGFELVATDKAGNVSYPWPYLWILEDKPGESSINGDARYFASRNMQFILDTEICNDTIGYPAPGRPLIWLGGYQAFAGADYEFGPYHSLTAIVMDPDGPDDIEKVELYVYGIPTGMMLEDTGLVEDFGPNDSVFGVNITLPGKYNAGEGQGYLPAGPLPLEIRATDRSGASSDLWPYFVVNP